MHLWNDYILSDEQEEILYTIVDPEEKYNNVEMYYNNMDYDNPLREICLNIQKELQDEGTKVTKSTMKSKLVKDIKAGLIESSLRPDLIKYIQKHCPEELN